ncbi:MAG: MerR family transcriptional regulator [Steroidobacteraceae bacterium]
MNERTVAKPMRLTIGRLSTRATVNIETVRYYEKVGLLPSPPRTAGGHRLYGEAHVKRLTFVRRARELGFTLEEIRALLHLADERPPSCARARSLATKHLADVREKIADLKRMERVLTQTVALCEEGDRPECPLLEALFRENASESSSRSLRRA